MSSSGPAEQVRIESAGLTDVGRVRKQNEDSILVRPDLGLFVVADGMGGHQAGDLASQITVAQFAEFFEQTVDGVLPEAVPNNFRDLEPGAQRLVLAVLRANRKVCAAAREVKGRDGMGSTVAAVHVCPDGMVHIGHVGDSRVYRISGGEIEQTTQDHSFFNQVRWKSPDLEPELLAALPKNVITKALGISSEAEPDVRTEMALPGDIYLLCSDGLSGFVSAEEVLQIVQSNENLKEVTAALVAAANSAGGKDNISVIMVRVAQSAASGEQQPARCPQCGVALVGSTAFCVECGAKL